ncbi:aminotransferase class V-fold PLP-dependent enzyme [Marivita sp. S6314]|uniref:aminotransferase class V-fold PLP-dependent enzyme n=1 Tax=Marivita sp. S6314 TaxID=2926406 RepID=UPI001FF3E199|nr:aminotransferase class V-fold PLP-dependent enzyme [Marivita sp. S6314]MCK0151571.1 aminotransferase class V-fold PLP-dependent enzyme [Marivita sp. S6314]
MCPLDDFKTSLLRDDVLDWVRAGLIGDGIEIDGPFGPKPLIYADYVASGRALDQVEDFVRHKVLPYYANSHTQASFCGSYVTRLREAARREVGRLTGAGAGISVVFTGSGSTAAINRIVALLNIARIAEKGGRVVVFVGPYEHHSNLLPWRESGAEVVEIAEGATGGPCLAALGQALEDAAGADLVVGAFSAASNVTGIVTDVDAVTRLLKSRGALAIWDYGCGAPYMPMDMKSGTDAAKDAIVFSPHKFPGGPGASGVMILRDAVVTRHTPTLPGGGSVSFVSPWGHTYSERVQAREEAGTPNVIGDIRVALAMLVKEALGQARLDARHTHLRERAEKVWSQNSRLQILGAAQPNALPIFSFRVPDGRGGFVHQQLFTRLLSDVSGVQARGGCACAGSYAHRLLNLDAEQSANLERAISEGHELEKPGWVRLNLSALMTDEKVDRVIDAVDRLAFSAADYQTCYRADPATARFFPVDQTQETLAS